MTASTVDPTPYDGFYIKLKDLRAHGFSEGCPKCAAIRVAQENMPQAVTISETSLWSHTAAHTAACKERIGQAINMSGDKRVAIAMAKIRLRTSLAAGTPLSEERGTARAPGTQPSEQRSTEERQAKKRPRSILELLQATTASSDDAVVIE